MQALVITDAGIAIQSFQELRDDLKKEWEAVFGDAIDLCFPSARKEPL